MTSSGITSWPDESALLDQEIIWYSRRGWEVIHRDTALVQFRKHKQWWRGGLLWLVLFPFLLGIAALFLHRALVTIVLDMITILGLIVVVVDYLMKGHRIETVTLADIRSRGLPASEANITADLLYKTVIRVALVLMVIVGATCFLIYILGQLQ